MRHQFCHILQFCVVKTMDGVVGVPGNLLKWVLKLFSQAAKTLGKQPVETLISTLLGTTIHNHVAKLILRKKWKFRKIHIIILPQVSVSAHFWSTYVLLLENPETIVWSGKHYGEKQPKNQA